MKILFIALLIMLALKCGELLFGLFKLSVKVYLAIFVISLALDVIGWVFALQYYFSYFQCGIVYMKGGNNMGLLDILLGDEQQKKKKVNDYEDFEEDLMMDKYLLDELDDQDEIDIMDHMGE